MKVPRSVMAIIMVSFFIFSMYYTALHAKRIGFHEACGSMGLDTLQGGKDLYCGDWEKERMRQEALIQQERDAEARSLEGMEDAVRKVWNWGNTSNISGNGTNILYNSS